MPFSEANMQVYRTQLDTPEHLSHLGFMNKTTLLQTFELLRDYAPSASLLIQNVLASEHLILRQTRPLIKQADELPVFYRVAIEPEDIVKILGLLTGLGQEIINNDDCSENKRQHLKTILQSWTYIGDWIIKRALGEASIPTVNPVDKGAQ